MSWQLCYTFYHNSRVAAITPYIYCPSFLPLVTLSFDSQPLIYLNGSPEVSSGIGFHLTLLTTHLLLNVDFTQLLKFA